MTQPASSPRFEPGKQLPQSLAIEVKDGNNTRDGRINFQLFVPKDYRADGAKWPLLIFLHGIGESGVNEIDRRNLVRRRRQILAPLDMRRRANEPPRPAA